MKTFKKEIMRDWWNKNLDYLPLGARWRGKWQIGAVKNMIREIDERALDIEIAEKVFGHKVTIVEFSNYDSVMESYYPELSYLEPDVSGEYPVLLPNYSTDIKDAWKIVEHLNGPKMAFSIWTVWEHYKEFKWLVRWEFWGTERYEFKIAETPEKAICLAALEAVNAKQ